MIQNFDTSASISYVAKGARLHGWNFREREGKPCKVQFRNGGSGGAVLIDLELAAKANAQGTPPRPIYFSEGIYMFFEAIEAGAKIRGTIDIS
jgi:hypothetical protein